MPVLRKVILPVIVISPGLLRIRMCLELTSIDMKKVEIARAEMHLDNFWITAAHEVTLPDAISHILTESSAQASSVQKQAHIKIDLP